MDAYRYWEIDFLRGLAILMMLIYHLLFDLTFFYQLNIEIDNGFWYAIARLTASLFIFLAGVSLALANSCPLKAGSKGYYRTLKRGALLFLWGMVITIITKPVLDHGYIRFGILHFLGISLPLAYGFRPMGYWNLPLALGFILLGNYLKQLTFDFSWLLWLGFIPVGFYSVDYFPLFPWFGVLLLGLTAGTKLYGGKKRAFSRPQYSPNKFIQGTTFLGRHSLLIYLIHQPVLLVLLQGISLFFPLILS